MFFYLLLLFTLVPLIELGLLIWIGTRTSLWFTLGLVIATGVLGATLARWQGWRAAVRVRAELAKGRVPADAFLDALLIFVAGLVLITPGILTDAAGFALLIPPVRGMFKRRLVAWFIRHVQVQTEQFAASVRDFPTPGQDTPFTPTGHSRIVDAKVIETRVEEESGPG